MLINKFSFFLLLPIIATLHSCLDSEEYDLDKLAGINVSPSYAFPLATGGLKMADLLHMDDSATLRVRDDQVLYFHYEKNMKDNTINETLALPDVGAGQTLTLPSDKVVPANTELLLFEVDSELSLPNGPEFHSILYKAGSVLFEMSSTLAVDLKVEVTFPTITKSGTTLAKTIFIDPANGNQAAAELLLQGFEADLTTSSPAYNTIPFKLSVTAVNDSNSDITLRSGEELNAAVNFVGQEYKLATGFFGDVAQEFEGLKLKVGPFTDILKYDAHFSQVDLNMIISNSYGIPIKLSFPVFQAVNQAGEVMNIETDPADGILINAPQEPGGEVVTPFNIVNEVAIGNFNPVEIRYSVRAHLNNGLTNANNFTTDMSRLSFHLSADIPLVGNFREIVTEDTLVVDLKDALTDTEVTKITLNTNLVNQFPFGGDFQIYTLDSQGNITDSLLTPEQTAIIPESTVTAAGDLLEPGKYHELIPMARDKFDHLTQASELIIKARLSTIRDENDNYPDVKFKSSYSLGIDLGILAEFETTIQP